MKEKSGGSLDALDMLILNAVRDDPSLTNSQVAKKIKRAVTTVARRMKAPALADAITDIKGSVDEILDQAKHLAARRMKRLILSKSEAIALKASTEILKTNLTPTGYPSGNEVRFVTVVNEVGVLESTPVPIEATAVIEGDIEDGID